VTVNADGSYTYTPSADYSGPDSFTYTVTDGQRGSNTYTVSITVTPANDAAIIGDPTVAGVTEDVSVTGGELRAEGVIAISDADAGQASFKTTVMPGAGVLGTLTLNSNGSYVYAVANAAVQSLAAGEVKTETFTIEAADGTTKEVSFTITGTNDRPVLAAPAAISLVDTAAAANLPAVTGTLAAGDVDAEAELTYSVAGGTTTNGPWTFGAVSYDVMATGAYGTLYLRSATGQYRFVPDDAAVDRLLAGETPAARFAFTVTDEHGAADSQDLVIEVTGADDTAAITGTATGSVREDATLAASGTLTLVDRDAGESSFEAPGSLAGDYGTFVFNAGTGAWSYSLNNGLDAVQSLKAGSTLTDRLTVTSKDGSASRTITVTIEGTNDKPDLATPAAISLADTTAIDRFDAVEGMLSATDKDALDTKGYSGGSAVDYRVTSDTTPTLTGAMPVLPGQRLEVVLNNVTYRVGDGTLTHEGGVWSLKVPTGLAAGSYTLVATVHDAIGAVSSTTTTLVIDPLASALVKTYDRMASNAFGTLYLNRSTGAYRFLANGAAVDALGAGETATASFGLTVTDSAGESDSADLLINVTGANDGPRAAEDAAATREDTSVTFDVRANDSDVDGDALSVVEIDGSPLSAGSPVAITGGMISLNADGTLTFSPAADYSGTATFTYRVSDGNGGLASARVTIVVTSVDDGATEIRVTGGSVLEGAPKGTLAGNVTVEDPDGGTYRYELVDDAGGRFTVDADGRILVADGALLDYETSRSHRVSVRITGPDGTSVTRDALILVGDVNEPSVARADSYTVDQGTTLTIPATSGVLANDSDPEAAALTAAIVSGPANGTLALAADGSLVYTPNPGFAGTDQFTYRAADGSPVPGTATVTISVRAIAVPPPVIAPPPVVVVAPPAPVTPLPPPVEVPSAPTQSFPIPVDPIVTPSATFGSPVADTASLLVANIAPTGYTLDAGGFRTAIVESSEAALVLFRGVPDREFDSGSTITFSVPNDAFAHTKSDEVVTLIATLLDGTPLPGWLAFSSEKGVFEGVPPKGYQGELVIKVVARDKQGREAAATFRVKVNGGEAATDGTETGELRAKNVKRTAGIPLNAGRAFADVRAKATVLAKRL
jgi:VCBS repeat-containing protein